MITLLAALLLSTPAAAPAPPKSPAPAHHVVGCDGHPVTVWEKKPKTAEPRGVLVLIHGRTWSGRPDFDLQVPGERRSLMDRLTARGWVAIAVDLRGYGATPRDPSGWLSPERAAKDVAEVLQWARQRHGKRPALLGWSMGALVAHLTAQRYPKRVEAVILYGYPRGVDAPAAPESEPSGPPRDRKNTEAAAKSDFRTPGAISERAADAFAKAAVKADPTLAPWARLHEYNALDPARLSRPTLVIHGVDDPYSPPERAAGVVAALGTPDRWWVVLPSSDHAAHLERPGRFTAAVVGFLERG